MILDTGFIPPRRDRMPWIVGGLMAFVATLLAMGVFILRAGLELRADNSRLEERLAELAQRRLEQKAGTELPAVQDLTAVRERVAAINGVVAQRGRPTAQLLATLERLLPDRAYLAGLHHLPKDGDVTLVAASADSAALATFMQRLESAPEFANVLLARRTEATGGPGVHTQFELKLKEAP